MVKPSQPRGIKPKVEINDPPAAAESGGSSSMSLTGQKLIIINTLITLIISVLFIGGNYLIVSSVMDAKFSHFAEMTDHEEEEEEYEEVRKKGIILDLGEFIVNLSNPATKRYLKVNVALELTKAPHDPDLNAEHSGGHGGHGHGSSAPNPLEVIEREMQQYKPSIRDAIISVLSSKSTEELSSLAGKELAKEQIKEAIDPIFAGEREVIRVSFGTFIIQ